MKRTKKLTTAILSAAVAGLLTSATLTLTACGSKTDAAGKEHNGCGGPNGCGGAKAETDKNKCSGPNGCNGHGAEKK